MSDNKHRETALFLQALERFLRLPETGAPFTLELTAHPAADLSCRWRGSTSFGLLKFTDFYSFYNLDELPAGQVSAVMAELHQADRARADAEFRVPKLLRVHVPNVVTVGLRAGAFPSDALELVRRSTFSPGAGEAHQLAAIQTEDGLLFTQPENRVRNMNFETTDPINRARAFLTRVTAGCRGIKE